MLALIAQFAGWSVSHASASGEAFIDHLRRIQDQFHDRIPVYEDVSSAGNRFHAYAKIPNSNAAVFVNGSWTAAPHRGATSIRCQFDDRTGPNFGGFYFLNGALLGTDTRPRSNFGELPNAGVDLRGVVKLTFWARGENGGEQVEFFLAGVGRNASTGKPIEPFPDSSPRYPARGTRTTLTKSWRQYSIDGLAALDLSYVLGGFAWVADDVHNVGGATFFLDDIAYELSPAARARRLDEPRFLASYVTQPIQPLPGDCATSPGFDLALRNTAFSYDNALAILAFLAHGSPDDLRRARLVGDAFVYVTSHDRFPANANGRARSAYAAGDIVLPPGWRPNGVDRAAALPGFYCEEPQTFFEVGQEALDVGNNAWVVIALLALHRVTDIPEYLSTAIELAQFIRSQRQEVGSFQGFRGGLEGFESESVPPLQRPWASAEHNLDVYAATRVMAELTGDGSWEGDAEHARVFVETLWDAGLGCYRAGTLDPETLNTVAGQLPLDVQAWSILALPDTLLRHPNLLSCPKAFHGVRSGGFTGFDFNEDRDGIWFEGTGQMATALAMADAFPEADFYRAELVRAQNSPPFGDGRGIVATTEVALTTGFGFEYVQRLHIAAVAWAFFAVAFYNPYYQDALPREPCQPTPTRLCLNDSRFAVGVEWLTPSGETGAGWGGYIGPNTGTFWFFDPNNVEVVVKVLDACVPSGRFWFFAAGLTDVEVRLVVTDTSTGITRRYRNALSVPFQPIQDTEAFTTCP